MAKYVHVMPEYMGKKSTFTLMTMMQIQKTKLLTEWEARKKDNTKTKEISMLITSKKAKN
jgi:hypothetical protein